MVLGVLCVGCVLVRYLGLEGFLVLGLGGFLLDYDGAAALLQELGDDILDWFLGIGRLYPW